MSEQAKALRLSGAIIAAFGVALALTVIPALHGVVWVFLQIAYWPFTQVPTELSAPSTLLVAISGGLIAGVGATFWGLGTHVAQVSAEAACKVARLTAWCWFAVDSCCSVLAGAPINAVLNLSFLGLMLWAARPHATTRAMV